MCSQLMNIRIVAVSVGDAYDVEPDTGKFYEHCNMPPDSVGSCVVTCPFAVLAGVLLSQDDAGWEATWESFSILFITVSFWTKCPLYS